jgi:hypothetical protein
VLTRQELAIGLRHEKTFKVFQWKQMAGKTDFVSYRFHFKTTLKKKLFFNFILF